MDLKAQALQDDSQIICPECGVFMKYTYGGRFVCEKCGAEQLNDYGKIKEFLQEHGPTNAIELSSQTGVKRSKITQFLREGKVEIPENSPIYIHCRKCGVAIRYGNYCSKCAHSNNIQGAYVGEIPKYIQNGDSSGKMRFMDTD